VLGGTLSAVAYALLIARLDSRIIGLPSSLITVLYSYAALQPLFVAFNQGDELFRVIEVLAIFAALLFKVCLILIVIHLRRSKALSDYLWFFPILHRQVNSVFDNQFEIRSFMIKPESFSFSVLNRNVEVYRAEESYKTRGECDVAVRDLVECMKVESSFHLPKDIQGTFWLKVKDLNNEPICESTSLQSEQECYDLRDESMAKIPFCKYNRG
jgi:hypothetical protein